MARRKGKSERRVKDWQQRYTAPGEFADTAAKRQRLAPRAVKIPSWRQDDASENLDDLPHAEGMVVGHFPGGAIVRVGSEELLCAIAGTFRSPAGASALAVGDDVTVAVTRSEHRREGEDDKDRADGMILARGPRRTVLARPRPRSGKRTDQFAAETFDKVIAANMDVLLIVASTRRPPLNHALVDRFLIIAERGELRPVLAINKIDLAPPDEHVLADMAGLVKQVFTCSAVTGQGLQELRVALLGNRTILAGASGVGKSTVINAMIPGANAATRPVRAKNDRGRHVTSAAAIYDLPGGGVLVDTPGIRELGLGLDAAELPWYFPEFERLAPLCKFNDCTHTREPGCAVLAAVEAGDILLRRYESYRRILVTLEER